MNPSRLGTALGAVALACAVTTAQATMVTFDGPSFDISKAPDAPTLPDKTTVSQSGITLTSLTNSNYSSPISSGEATGALVDGQSGQCFGDLICPDNPSGNYLVSLNDGTLEMRAEVGYIQLKSFDASFVGPAETITSPFSVLGLAPGLMVLWGTKGDGSGAYLASSYFLPNGDADGKLHFAHFELKPEDQAQAFVSITFASYFCEGLNCQMFTTNASQFALDNIDASAVIPEPADWLLTATSLAALGFVRRRRIV